MVNQTCKSCGFALEEPDARFCPGCGRPLDATRIPQVSITGNLDCPGCGSTSDDPGAQFCLQCGNGLKDRDTGWYSPPIPTHKPVQADERREVCGPKVKDAPMARYFDGTKRDDQLGIQGDFKLHEDGIRFRYKQLAHGGFENRWEFMHFHISTIARASPGEKSHWLVLEMKDGRTIRFKFAGAAKWADLIKNYIP